MVAGRVISFWAAQHAFVMFFIEDPSFLAQTVSCWKGRPFHCYVAGDVRLDWWITRHSWGQDSAFGAADFRVELGRLVGTEESSGASGSTRDDERVLGIAHGCLPPLGHPAAAPQKRECP